MHTVPLIVTASIFPRFAVPHTKIPFGVVTPKRMGNERNWALMGKNND